MRVPRDAAGTDEETDGDKCYKDEGTARCHSDSSSNHQRYRAEHNPTRCVEMVTNLHADPTLLSPRSSR